MDDKLVAMSLQLLSLLSRENNATGLGVNDLVRETGSKDKPHVLKSIKFVEDAGLVRTVTDSRHQQKKVKVLTAEGLEFGELIHNISYYGASYKELEEAIRRHYGIPEDYGDSFLSKLRSRGLDEREAYSYRHWRHEIKRIELQAPTSFIVSLLVRYSNMLSRLKLNFQAKIILLKLITDPIDEAISASSSLMSSSEQEREEIRLAHLRSLAREAFIFPRLFYMTFEEDEFEEGKHDKFVKNEVQQLGLSIMAVLKPSSELVEHGFVKDLQGFMESNELKKIATYDEYERSAEELYEAQKNRLVSEAYSMGLDVRRDVILAGSTMKLKVEMMIEKGNRRCIVIFYYLHMPKYLDPRNVKQWIFPVVDLVRGQHEKIVFVYSGEMKYDNLVVLKHYYDAVIEFEQFRKFLFDEFEEVMVP